MPAAALSRCAGVPFLGLGALDGALVTSGTATLRAAETAHAAFAALACIAAARFAIAVACAGFSPLAISFL